MMSDDQIRQEEIKKDEPKQGWLLTYADMMTLLFAFFVMLFAMSSPDPVKMSQVEDAMKETKAEEINLNSQRNSMSNDIEQKYYGSYEKIRGAHEGVGVVSISRDACGNCFSQLPPQIIIEIKKSIDVIMSIINI